VALQLSGIAGLRERLVAIAVVRSGEVPSEEAIVSDGQCRSGLAIAFLAAGVAAAC
jgi:hypothetical protein